MALRSRVLHALLAALVLVILPPGARADEPSDLWYVLTINGVRSGYSRETVIVGEDRITTSSVTSMTMKRGPVSLPIVVETTFVETLDGRPLFASSEQRMGSLPSVMQVEFKNGEMHITRSQAGQTATQVDPLPKEEWLPPAAARRFVAQRLEAGASEIAVRTLDLTTGTTPVLITRKDLRPDTEVVNGQTIDTRLAASFISAMPGLEFKEEFDLEGRTVVTHMNLGGMEIVTRLATEREATAPIKGAAEIMVRTLVKSSAPIKTPRDTSRASMRLSIASDVISDLPTAGAQRVERIDARTLRVTVDRASPAPAPEADLTNDAYTRGTLMCQSEDAEIVALVERATKGVSGPAARAEAMRRFVRSYLTNKSLDVGFASASETARSRAGDCSEHAVLLAAMLRADGIPSRGVTGLVYVDEFLGETAVFGYHMWTQALLEVDGVPTWIDLDAAIDDDRPFDATHVAVSLASFGDDESIEAFQAVIPLMGSLSIDVESIE